MNFKIDTLGKRIGLGYFLMVIILACAVLITIKQVDDVNQASHRLRNLRHQSYTADIELLNGINRSIADLRGWVLLRKDTFRVGRKRTWKEAIRLHMAKLEELSPQWNNSEDVQLFATLRPLMDQLELSQEQTEILAETDIDAAVDYMDKKVLPLNEEIRSVMSQLMISHENSLVADFDLIENRISMLNNVEWILFVIGTLLSMLLAAFITRSITTPVSKAVLVAQNIGDGDLETKVDIKGSKELETLGAALVEMRDSLFRKNEETRRYDWLTSGQNRLNEVMRGDQETGELANNIVTLMASYTGSSIGSIYLINDKGELEFEGGYAHSFDGTKFKMGEGLVGQVAMSKQRLMLTGVDEQAFRIKSALVDTLPDCVIASPFLFEGNTMGVIELGKLTPYTEVQEEFIQAAMEPVGIALYSAVARKKIRELLEETQRQSDELQQQQEELEQNNEELEEQTQKLTEQQEELQAANEELEEQAQIVEQKNHDLEAARIDIELKSKQIEIRSQYKSEFLANMSHELRTPLNSLLILSRDLAENREENLTEDQVESAEVIAKSGQDLLVLINEILDLSKIEAGKMNLNIGRVSIIEMADNIRRNFRRNIHEKGLDMEVEVSDTLPETIDTDQQRLEQVVKNLVSNAIKFTEKGSVKVSFDKDAGNRLIIAVEDTGIGIAPDKQDIIFEAFQQAEGGTSRKYGGTGLGLSISRELTKLLNGTISVESKVGQGSVFTITIPLEFTGDEPIPEVKPRPAPHKKISADPNSRFLNYPTVADERDNIGEDESTILIIEDDQNFVKLLAKQAREKGFRYICAATGEDGLALAAQYHPKAIILDLELPGIDGHTVLKELKGDPDLRHIPVHIISSYEKTLDPIKSGAVEYLTKPVSKDQLEEAFTRMEDFINRKMKNLLIIEDDTTLRRSIIKLIGNGDVKCMEAGTGQEALDIIKNEAIDCIVLDIGLPDMSGMELIKKLEERSSDVKVPPIIIYTGKELTILENNELQQHAETIIVKGVKSEERLLDETALFLHRTVQNMPRKKQDMITGLYDKERIFQNKKVLLVDDDMRNVFALSKVLKEKGLIIEKAENGLVALEKLDKMEDADLVLMDIMMPEMDGYQCMREIRKQSRYKNLPIIAITAKAMKEDRQKCIDAGANDYITKPVDIQRLLSLMRIWIKKDA